MHLVYDDGPHPGKLRVPQQPANQHLRRHKLHQPAGLRVAPDRVTNPIPNHAAIQGCQPACGRPHRHAPGCGHHNLAHGFRNFVRYQWWDEGGFPGAGRCLHHHRPGVADGGELRVHGQACADGVKIKRCRVLRHSNQGKAPA